MKLRWSNFKIRLAQYAIDFCEGRVFAAQEKEDIYREVWWEQLGRRFL